MRINRIAIDQAVDVLNFHITTIGTVTEWAWHMGYSRSYFSIRFRKIFGREAIRTLIQTKFKLAEQILQESPDIKSKDLAERAGFSNSRAFRRFLRNNFDIGINQFRKRSLSERAYEYTLS